MSILYSTLLHLPPLRFHYVGGCWDRTQDSCDFGIVCQTLLPVATRLHLMDETKNNYLIPPQSHSAFSLVLQPSRPHVETRGEGKLGLYCCEKDLLTQPPYVNFTLTLIKKKIKFSSYIRKFRVEQLSNGLLIYGKYLHTSSHIRTLFLRFDFATAPL